MGKIPQNAKTHCEEKRRNLSKRKHNEEQREQLWRRKLKKKFWNNSKITKEQQENLRGKLVGTPKFGTTFLGEIHLSLFTKVSRNTHSGKKQCLVAEPLYAWEAVRARENLVWFGFVARKSKHIPKTKQRKTFGKDERNCYPAGRRNWWKWKPKPKTRNHPCYWRWKQHFALERSERNLRWTEFAWSVRWNTLRGSTLDWSLGWRGRLSQVGKFFFLWKFSLDAVVPAKFETVFLAISIELRRCFCLVEKISFRITRVWLQLNLYFISLRLERWTKKTALNLELGSLLRLALLPHVDLVLSLSLSLSLSLLLLLLLLLPLSLFPPPPPPLPPLSLSRPSLAQWQKTSVPGGRFGGLYFGEGQLHFGVTAKPSPK